MVTLEYPPHQGPATYFNLRQRDGITMKLPANDDWIEPVDVIVVDDACAHLRHARRLPYLDPEEQPDQETQDRTVHATTKRDRFSPC